MKPISYVPLPLPPFSGRPPVMAISFPLIRHILNSGFLETKIIMSKISNPAGNRLDPSLWRKREACQSLGHFHGSCRPRFHSNRLLSMDDRSDAKVTSQSAPKFARIGSPLSLSGVRFKGKLKGGLWHCKRPAPHCINQIW